MNPIFDGREAVEKWQREGGRLRVSYSNIYKKQVWWHFKSRIWWEDAPYHREAILAAGYSEEEADEMMEGK